MSGVRLGCTEHARLPASPLLKPWYRVACDGGRIVLEYADTTLVLEGGATRRLIPALLPLLDGRHTVDEITSELGSAAAPAVERVLAELLARDVLTEGPSPVGDGLGDDTAAVLAALEGGSSPGGVRDVLASRRATVAGDGAHADDLATALERSGLEAVRRVPLSQACASGENDLVVAAPAAGELQVLDEVNEGSLRDGTPWLQVLPFDGRIAAVGPLFVPGETCCRRCYLLRRAAASGYPDEFWPLQRAAADRPMPPFLRSTVAGLAAFLALRWLLRGDAAVTGRLLALELSPSVSLSTHVVFRVPRCPACSFGAANPLPWYEANAPS